MAFQSLNNRVDVKVFRTGDKNQFVSPPGLRKDIVRIATRLEYKLREQEDA